MGGRIVSGALIVAGSSASSRSQIDPSLAYFAVSSLETSLDVRRLTWESQRVSRWMAGLREFSQKVKRAHSYELAVACPELGRVGRSVRKAG